MKVDLLTENLKKGLGIVMRGVSTKVSLPVLSTILLKADKEGLTLESTDLEISLKVRIRAKVEEAGSICVPAKLFSELVSTLSAGTIGIVVEKEALLITGAKIKTQIMGQSSAEFPALPETRGKGITLDIKEYKEKMERVAVSAARDDTRPVLSGVLWQVEEGVINLVATDGYRLGLDKLTRISGIEELKGKKFILPVRAVLELSRIAEGEGDQMKVEFDADKQQVIFSLADVEMSSRLIAGEFPPFQKVIPVEKRLTINVDKMEMTEAVRRAALFARDNSNVVKLLIEDGIMKVVADSDASGKTETEIEVGMEGEGVKAAFNAKYLVDYLSVVTSEKILMETEGELKPAVFRIEEDSFVHIIMPFRVQN
jgi:DNA polymerase-3 subunit beta